MSRTPRTEETSVRKQRVPVAAQRAPLRYKGLDHKNYYYRWVLDRDDRLQMFLDAGYVYTQPVSQVGTGDGTTVDSSKGLDSRVSKHAGFGGLKLYLMQLERKFYNEDQVKKQEEVDKIEEPIIRPGKRHLGVKEADYGSIHFSRTKTFQPPTEDQE